MSYTVDLRPVTLRHGNLSNPLMKTNFYRHYPVTLFGEETILTHMYQLFAWEHFVA